MTILEAIHTSKVICRLIGFIAVCWVIGMIMDWRKKRTSPPEESNEENAE